MDKKKIKITFAPDAFKDFEGTQEELDEFLEHLTEWLEESEVYEDEHQNSQEVFVHAVSIDTPEQELQNQSKRLH